MDTMHHQALNQARQLLKKANFDALLVRSTDRYFNEYVPEYANIRAYVSGFKGSVGDALIREHDAHLFVDGRYALQAKQQAPLFTIHVTHSLQTIEQLWLEYLKEHLKNKKLAYDPATIDSKLFDQLSVISENNNIKLGPEGGALLQELSLEREQISHKKAVSWHISQELSGQESAQKIALVQKTLKNQELDGYLLVKLDDIAWVLNIRSTYFPYQCTMPALACIVGEQMLIAPAEDLTLPKDALGQHVRVVSVHNFIKELRACKKALRIGIDPSETSKQHEMALQSAGIELQRVSNPVAALKAIKNEQELLHMRRAFKTADQVVYKTQNFIIDTYCKGQTLSEGEIDDQIKEQFFASGAKELSFRPICAGGKNGAIIHYGSPHREQKVEDGSLFLLDTGAYYEGGYATDLTRTFLAAGPDAHAKAWQREMFTLVLKASIKGLSARIRRGTLGRQLDAMVRAPLWQAGLDYAHGTGHGVGINVHEFPPRIGPTSMTELKEGQVFSIEPGIYLEGLGGVRIENLATLVDDGPLFLRVLPLTFCPLDKRLIEQGMLDSYELEFLNYFEKEWHNDAAMPSLPPLPQSSFIGK